MDLFILRNFKNSVLFFFMGCMLVHTNVFAQAGSWAPLTHTAPHYNDGVMLLLTDGTVICKNSNGGDFSSSDDGLGTGWDRLTPVNGSYINGTWSSIASMDSPRLYFSSQVLQDGRVYVCGGEYGGGGKWGEIYNPITNTWAFTGGPTGYQFPNTVSDANSELLPNGNILQASVDESGVNWNYLYNPATNTYTRGPNCLRLDNEAVWVKLPDNSILFMDNYGETSERYIPATNTWISDATAPENLFDPYGSEAGAGFLLPNGKVWFIGSLPNSLYYTPSGTTSPGTWTAGPSLPNSQGAPDAAAAMLPNGHILLTLSPTPTSANHFPSPTKYYEFDYTTNTFTLLSPPWGSGDSTNNSTYISNMLVLPDGNVLFTNLGDDQYYEYIPGSSPIAAGQPTVNSVNKISCDTFQVTGTLFNGIGEGAAYGDDWQMSSNYPIVKLTSGSNVYFATTYNWNRLGAVMTGTALDTAIFTLPAGLPAGSYSLQVIANGNPSANYAFNTIPAPISPATASVCLGNSISLTDTTSGGSWSSSNSSVATVGSGIVNGVGAGTVIISYTVNGECSATEVVSIDIAPPAITGIEYTSIGDSTTLSDGTYGGAWSSTNTGIAKVNTVTGAVTGVAAGTTTISYINSCGSTSIAYTVLAGNLCIPAATDAGTSCSEYGLTFQSVNLAGVEGTAINDETACTGTGYIDLTSSMSCSLDKGSTYTINITAGYNSAYMQFWIDFNGDNVFESSESVGGNTTAFSGPGTVSITIPSTVSPGTNRMRGVLSFSGSGHHYPTMDPCMSGYTYGEARDYEVTILCNTTAVTGTAVVCPGAITALTDATGAGTWGSGNTAAATVGSTGIVTGVASGASVVSYSIGGCSSSVVVTVSPLPAAGSISGSSAVCVGSALTLTDASGGGVWSSTNTASGTVSAGVVGGVAAGSTTISYTVTNSCGTAAATKSVTINPLPVAGTISGAAAVCVSSSITLSDAAGGGVWSSSNTTDGSVSAGVVTGLAAGSTTISYTVTNGCGTVAATQNVTVNPMPVAGTISGNATVCAGVSTGLTDVSGGGAWGSASTTTATVGSTGIVNGIMAGSTTISYTVTNVCGTLAATHSITVNPQPVAGTISGISAICPGSSAQLSDGVAGGVWGSANTEVVTVGSSGLVTGVAGGSASVTYVVTNSCGSANASNIVSVNSLPDAGSISGAVSVMEGSDITLSDAVAGGAWSSANTSVATIGTTGILAGVSEGTVTISYSVSNICATIAATYNVAVTPTVTATVTITGNAAVCVGGTVALGGLPAGGSWSSANTSVATVDGVLGTVSGIASGTVGITYTEGGNSASVIVTVNALPDAGSISGISTVCTGATVTLSDVSAAGSWTSSATGTASVGNGSAAGVVSGITAGTATISFTVSNSCGSSSATSVVTVNSLPVVGAITGIGSVCLGSTVDLTDTSTTGYWSSGATTVATIASNGVVTGIAAGTASISYTESNSCGNARAIVVVSVTATSAGVVNGASIVTVGSGITLTDAITGGIWTASNTNVTVAGGLVTGVAAGTVVISYAVTGICGTSYATRIITVNNSTVSTISGSYALCAGGTTTLTDATAGGTWSMGNLVATINGSTGVVTASNSYTGTATVTYTAGGAYTTIVITVNPNPSAIQGPASECVGTTVILSDATSGGTWVATGNVMLTGAGSLVTLVADSTSGAAVITYTLPTGCFVTVTNTVKPNPLPIQGVTSGCVGGVIYLSDATGGATTWASSNTAVATAAGGDITGVGIGSATITYTINTGCAITANVLIGAQPSITGNVGAICPGGTVSLLAGPGTWVSSASTIAAVGTLNGVVTGVSGGHATISYAEAGTSGCTATTIVTVNASPSISGTAVVCIGGTTTLSDAVSGGTWSSGTTSVATVNGATGVVTGVASGTTVITYATASGCIGTLIVTVSGASAPISGSLVLCNGSTTTLSDAVTGGTWSSGSSLATVVGSTGVVTASATLTGTTTISYSTGGCFATAVITVIAKPTPIEGVTAECPGLTTSLTNATPGGAWSVSGDATIVGSGTAAALIAGPVGGSATITYSIGSGCSVTAGNTIYSSPQPIQGNFSLCVGLVNILSDASPVNTWSSSNTAVATCAGGDITGVSAGVAIISFRTGALGYCTITQAITVNAMPVVSPISGPATISHSGSPISISDATTGGVWTSSNPAIIALAGSTGNPIEATAMTTTGSAVITYAVTAAGCTTKVTKTYSASAASHPGGGNTTVLAGSMVNIADDITGGLWNSSDNSIATVDGGGLVTGIKPGSVDITHECMNLDGSMITNITSVTVSAAASITISPNPNKGTFLVKGSLGAIVDENVTLEVTDLLGQAIYIRHILAPAGKLDETITLANNLPNGIYILDVQNGSIHNTFHFVIEQ